MNTYLCVYLGSAFLAMVITPAIIWLAHKIKTLDSPELRKVHLRPVLCIGGVAIIVSTIGLVLPVLFLQNTVGEASRWRTKLDTFDRWLITLLTRPSMRKLAY